MLDLIYNSNSDTFDLFINNIKRASNIRRRCFIDSMHEEGDDSTYYWVIRSITLGFYDSVLSLSYSDSYFTFWAPSISDVVASANRLFNNSYELTYLDDNPCLTLKSQDYHIQNDRLVIPNIEFSFDDFETNLYPELINNHETKSMLETWTNDGDLSGWTSDDKQIMQMIEDYNHNVLQLRATKKVNASVSGSISQSGQSQTVDLTATNNALNNIANKLKRTETIDNQKVEKNITQTINDLNLSNQTIVTTVEKAPYNPLLDDGSDIDF